MRRIAVWMSVWGLILVLVPRIWSHDEFRIAPPENLPDGLLRLEHDPNCPGCRAFLAGYGPSCSCEAATAGEGMAGPSDGSGTELGAELASTEDFGTGYGYQSAAPNMIGDFFGGGYSLDSMNTFNSGINPNIPIAGGDRRFKVSENTSPLPRDRVFFTFNRFQNALLTIGGQELSLNRYTFGLEKTFWGGLASVEVRAPLATGLAANQTNDGNDANDSATEFGNMTLVPKFALVNQDGFLVSTGMGINLPTAASATLNTNMFVGNDSVHLMPFLGTLFMPGDSNYLVGYVQCDLATNGDRVIDGGSFLGRLQGQNLLHLDLAVGRWIYRNNMSSLTGIAPQIELHYTSTMQDSDRVGPFFNQANRVDTLVLTGGLNFQFFNATTLTLGCAVPLRGNVEFAEKQYDAEFQVLFNRFF